MDINKLMLDRPHCDGLREEHEKNKLKGAESLQSLADGNNLMISWGPCQYVLNEPMEQCGVIEREHYRGCSLFYKFYHIKLEWWSIKGEIIKNDKVVNKFIVLENLDVVSEDVIIGRVFCNSGVLFLDFQENTKDIVVFCSYEWNNS